MTTFFGWRIVAAATALQALVSLLFFQAYGAFAPFWMAEFGWSRTAVSMVFSLHRTESGLLGPIHGWLLQRFPPRNIVLAGVLILSTGFLLLSHVRSFGQFVAVFLFMAVGASFCGILSLMTVIVQWFERKRARALSFMHLGFSLGGLAIPVLAWGLVSFGWRPVALASAFLVLAVGVPLSRLLVRDPEALGLLPDGAPQPTTRMQMHSNEAGGGSGAGALRSRFGVAADGMPGAMTVRRALRTRTFWLISGGHAAAIAVAAAVMVHFVLYVHEVVGVAVTAAASMVAFMTSMAMVGQLLGGVLGDRFDKRRLAAASMIGHAMAMIVLASVPSVGGALAAAALHGLAVGVRGPLMGALKADFFGRKAFAGVSGFASLVTMLGSIGGPVIVGVTADLTGSYVAAFWLLAGLAAIGSSAFVALPRPAALPTA